MQHKMTRIHLMLLPNYNVAILNKKKGILKFNIGIEYTLELNIYCATMWYKVVHLSATNRSLQTLAVLLFL